MPIIYPTYYSTASLSGILGDFDANFAQTDSSGNVSSLVDTNGTGAAFNQISTAKNPAIFGGNGVINGNKFIKPVGAQELLGNAAANAILQNRTAITVYEVARYTDNSVTRGQYSFQGASAIKRLELTTATDFFSTVTGSTGDSASGVCKGMRALFPDWKIICRTFDYANNQYTIYHNGVIMWQGTFVGTTGSGTANTAGTNCYLFSTGGANYAVNPVSRFIFCSGIHNQATRDAVHQGLSNQYGIPCFHSTNTKRIVQVHGPSTIEASHNLSGPQDRFQSIPSWIYYLLGSPPDLLVVNYGWDGAIVSNFVSEAASTVDLIPTANLTKLVMLFKPGNNDISAGTAATTIYNTIKTYMSARNSAIPSRKLIVTSPICKGGLSGAQQTQLTSYYGLVTANAVNDGATAVTDWGGQSQFLYTNASSQTSSPKYFNGDNIHPTPLGNQILAQTAVNTIQTYL